MLITRSARFAMSRLHKRPASLEPETPHHPVAIPCVPRVRKVLGIDRLDEEHVEAEPAKPEQVLQYRPRRASLPWVCRDHPADDGHRTVHHWPSLSNGTATDWSGCTCRSIEGVACASSR